MTLVELMVAMVVISILASLSLAGLVVARTSAKRAKTSATIRKISEIILPYYEEYETRRVIIGNSAAVASKPNGRKYLADAKQIAIRRLMTLELPERVKDYLGASSGLTTLSVSYPNTSPVVLSEVPPCARRYDQLTIAKTPTSGELLHLIVTRGPVADPDVVAHFREDEVRDSNGNGLPEFVDGWNRPIMFKRWATGFKSPMQPLDGLLSNIDNLIASNGHRLVPLIYSAGLDGAYDIEAGNDLAYKLFDYDPFRFDCSAPNSPSASPVNLTGSQPASIPGEIVLVPSNASPLTFAAQRYPTITGSPPFFTVGSPRDTGSADGNTPNGILESGDNIHNHDMSR